MQLAGTQRKLRRWLIGTASAGFRTLAYLCLFASLWRAPLPWVHVHGEPRAVPMQQRLDRHLAAWHWESQPDDREWHLHFAMLDDLLRGNGCPIPLDNGRGEQPLTTRHVAPLEEAGRSSVHRLAVEWTPVCLEAVSPLQPSAGTVGPRFSSPPRETYSRRLLTVLCIARC